MAIGALGLIVAGVLFAQRDPQAGGIAAGVSLSLVLWGALRRPNRASSAAAVPPTVQVFVVSPPPPPLPITAPITVVPPAIVPSSDASSVASDRLRRGSRVMGSWIGHATRIIAMSLRQFGLRVDQTLAAIAEGHGAATLWTLRAAAIGVTLFVGWLVYLTVATIL